MSKLKFDINQVKTLMSKVGPNDKLTIVGDQGVYLMAVAESTPRTIIYAKGCNPDVDEDWYDEKGRVFGYDDGGNDFGTKAELQDIVNACSKHFIINLTKTSISCSNDAPARRPKTVKINTSHLPQSLIDKLPADMRAKLGR